TTHSIVGGVLGAGIAVAGAGVVEWATMAAIAASWVISPLLGAAFAAGILYFIKVRILYREDRLAAAQTWVPLLIALMAGTFMAYMALKGMNRLWRPGGLQVALYSALAFAATYAAARPYVRARIATLDNRRAAVN